MSLSDKERHLQLLFSYPLRPSFMPNWEDNIVFDVPSDYLSTRFKGVGEDIITKFGEGDFTHVPVQKITLPDFTNLRKLGRDEPFSDFLPYHRKLASQLISIFMDMRNLDDLTSAALYCRDNLNPFLFNFAYSVALLHRPDTRNIPIPTLPEIFPEKFWGNGIFRLARGEADSFNENQRIPLVIPRDYTASDLDEEHRLAYFREDLGINLHHWHWHLVYPFDGPRQIVEKDRRGELFYYMHQQIMARYNLERLCNRLARVKRLINLRDPIEEGYFPKLDTLVASRMYPSRHRNAFLSDIYRESDQIKFDLADLERWRERFYDAVHSGAVVDGNGDKVLLTEMGGVDILGNLLESSILSINKNVYGELHNLGHLAIAYCHDPDSRFLESFGVMGDSSTAMRDPIFYRWHAAIDDLFQEHKATLPRYTLRQLDFAGVQVTGVEVIATSGDRTVRNRVPTFWQESDVNLSRGMDFNPRGPVFTRIQHLQHAPFTYKITVENNGAPRPGTVRIFVGPKADERGLPMLFRDQKNLFIELDKFQVNLKQGTNVFERSSIDSSVTIPFERTFRNLDRDRPAVDTDAEQQFNFCGCGWPDHMLVPRGTQEGMVYQLFVMVSDYAQDRIDQRVEGTCTDAASFCGLRDKLYPDKRSMGYPFDRQPRNGVDTLPQFLTRNMAVQDITIQFTDRVLMTRSTPRTTAT